MFLSNLGNLFGKTSDGSKDDHQPHEKNLKVLKIYGEKQKKLERIIARSELISSGRVHLLGLDEIQKALGNNWPGLRERILKSLNKIVMSRIGVNDVFFSRSDNEHIIVFSNISNAGARLLCAKILKELNEIYLGSTETCKIVVKTAVGKIDGELKFEEISLDDILASTVFSEVSHEEAFSEVDQEVHLSDAELSYEVVYKPIWDSRNQAISTYMVNSRSMDRYKNIKVGYDILINPSNIEAMIDMDYVVMIETINTMDDLFMNNFRAIFSIPVCYETLFNIEMLKDFKLRCKVIPQALYKYISFTLVNFPTGVPEEKLRFIISELKEFSRAVVLVCDEIPKNVKYYADCGVKGLTLELPLRMAKPKEYWKNISLFADKCKKEHVFVSLANINRLDDLILAKDIGVNFFSGDVIGPYADTPGHMKRVSWQELISR